MSKIGGGPQHMEFLRSLYGDHETELCHALGVFVYRCKDCGITVGFLDNPCTGKNLSQENDGIGLSEGGGLK